MPKIDITIRSGDSKVDAYIESLEKFHCSNIERLIASCDEMAGVIANDVDIIAKSIGDDEDIDSKLQMLGSKKNKLYERFLSLCGNVKHFKAISDLRIEKEAVTPQQTVIKPIKPVTQEIQEEKVQPIRDIFEERQQQVKSKLKNG